MFTIVLLKSELSSTCRMCAVAPLIEYHSNFGRPVVTTPLRNQTMTRPVDELRQRRSGLPSALKSPAAFGTQAASPDQIVAVPVVFVPFSGGRPNGKAEDVVTGFLNADGEARGRPVGVAVDKTGALLIADDVGNTVWRVTSAGQ